MRHLAPLAVCVLAALAGQLVGCSQEKATIIAVSVEGKDGVGKAAALEVIFSHGGERLPNILSKGGEPFGFPLPMPFVIRADGREGPVEIAVKAKDASEYVIGEGLASGTIERDARLDLSVMLYPTDFQVNARYQGDQFFSTEAGFGRTVAAAPDGNFVAVWEDACPPPLQRCDVYYRLFDRTASARLNALTGKSEEHTANETNDYYDMPSVAMQAAGNFVAVWQRSPVSATAYKIWGRSFTADGRPDAPEIELSGSDAATARPSAPHIASLRRGDAGYVAVWQQLNGQSWEVKGRYLASNGAPAKRADGGSDVFTIASFTSSSSSALPHPQPVAVAGDAKDGYFMVLWNENGAIRGRCYGPKASALPKGVIDIDTAKSGKAREAAGSWLPYGYAIGWTDEVKSGPDTDGSSIRIRRLDLQCSPLQGGEAEYTANTSVAGDQLEPALATRSDGSLLVAWTSLSATQDPEGGIRGRRVLSNFLPVGSDFAINTTQTGKQEKAAIAAHSSESFVVLFVDSSKTQPDTLGSGIRGRILYPSYTPTDGQIGALCDATPCGAKLSCKQTDTGVRCIARCDASPLCEHGGVCRTLSGEPPEKVCIYNIK